MYTLIGQWCLTISGAKVAVYMVGMHSQYQLPIGLGG